MYSFVFFSLSFKLWPFIGWKFSDWLFHFHLFRETLKRVEDYRDGQVKRPGRLVDKKEQVCWKG